MEDKKIKEFVREGYAKVATEGQSCCGPKKSCGCGTATTAEEISRGIGYSDEEMKAVPDGANLGLGCGNPIALASLREGEVVVDLGSGAGFDCFLAANKVGKTGKVIGIDMTPEMLEKARQNAVKGGYGNVEFRLGEIEHMPVEDNLADIIISNCVINLSPDKKSVFKESFRVLKPGGRLMISDIVILKDLPDFIRKSIEAYIGCLSGAIKKDEYISAVKEAGFKEVKIIDEAIFPVDFMANDPTVKGLMDKHSLSQKDLEDLTNSISSIKLSAVK